MGKVIAVASGKGGTGKSFFALNIGAVIANEGKSVIIVDALKGEADIKNAVIRHRRNKNLYLLHGSMYNGDDETFGYEEIEELYSTLAQEYDYVLVDCPPGVNKQVIDICAGADSVVVIFTPDSLGIRCADSIVFHLRRVELNNIFMVVNRINKGLIESGDMLDENDIEELLGVMEVSLFGRLSENPNVFVSMSNGRLFMSMSPKSTLANELRLIGRKLILVSEVQ